MNIELKGMIPIMKRKIEVAYMLEKGALLPFQATSGARGYDIRAISWETRLSTVILNTGVALTWDEDEDLICKVQSRSGLRYGFSIQAFHGLIDADYRKPIRVMWNTVHHDRIVGHDFMRQQAEKAVLEHKPIAQLLFSANINLIPSKEGWAKSTHEGFGSTDGEGK